jgi:hypothetical protein
MLLAEPGMRFMITRNSPKSSRKACAHHDALLTGHRLSGPLAQGDLIHELCDAGRTAAKEGRSAARDCSDIAAKRTGPELSIILGMAQVVNRRRLFALIALLGVIGLGLASRTLLSRVPIVGKELGDVLWPVMFYLIAVVCLPRLRPSLAALFALAMSVGTESLQAYQATWIEELRNTRGVGIILGRNFSWHDMACYPIGTAIAWIADVKLLVSEK